MHSRLSIREDLARSSGLNAPPAIHEAITCLIASSWYCVATIECFRRNLFSPAIRTSEPQYLHVTMISPGLRSKGAPQCEQFRDSTMSTMDNETLISGGG